MKRWLAFAFVVVLGTAVFAGCGTADKQVSDSTVTDNVVSSEIASVPAEPTRMVMVDGRLYYDTGRASTMTARCGTMDGTIASTVEPGETPTQDGQSNFGSGFGWQYGMEENTIEIYEPDTWTVFEARR